MISFSCSVESKVCVEWVGRGRGLVVVVVVVGCVSR